MLTKLKKCKTLKEIYEVLGKNFFEKIAMYIVMGWCLLPILSIFFHIRWMGMAEQTFMYRLNILSSYQTAVLKENHGMYFFNVVCMDYHMYNAFE